MYVGLGPSTVIVTCTHLMRNVASDSANNEVPSDCLVWHSINQPTNQPNEPSTNWTWFVGGKLWPAALGSGSDVRGVSRFQLLMNRAWMCVSGQRIWLVGASAISEGKGKELSGMREIVID